MSTFYTVGHSSQSAEAFVKLLTGSGIEVLVDVRSAPYSRYTPQFDREILQPVLSAAGIKYLYLGDKLGGRPKNQDYYDAEGHAVYGRMTSDPAFISGIERLERGMAEFRLALMCGEEDPAKCHRRLLVSCVLFKRGHEIRHIRAGGRIDSDDEVTKQSGIPLVNEQPALFPQLDEDQWRSTASVLPKKAPANFSKP